MKRIFILLCLSIACKTSFAQIPNAGFETWTHSSAGGGYDTPDNWGTTNTYTAVSSTYTCQKGSTGAPSGSNYLVLTTKNCGIVVPGVAVTGSINLVGTTVSISGGIPFSSRPASLKGYWQYMAFGSDQGHIAVLLSKWNSAAGRKDTISFTDYLLPGMVMSWATFTIPLTYRSTVAPDSAIILLSSSGTAPVVNSYLWVDSLSFYGTAPSALSTVTNDRATAIVYPNPSTGNTGILYNGMAGKTVTADLCDLSGRNLRRQSYTSVAGDNRFALDISGIVPGIYLVRISDGEQLFTHKLTIE